MADLFSSKPRAPLAEALRPTSLDEVVGQSHLLGPGKPLRLMLESKKLHSFILWGPPGVGKTTLGKLAAHATDSIFMTLSAVLAGVKDIRAAVDAAQHALDYQGRSTVLFIDEIHSFNRSQQDALLPHVESGLICMIGSTTEHPGLQVTNALLSRSQVYALEPLELSDFVRLYERAKPHLEEVTFAEPALSVVASYSDGDGRRFLNLLEQVANAARASGMREVSADFVKTATSPALKQFDKSGDHTYWLLSAFHKSLRGSSPDGALYWLARIIEGGGDGRQAARRMMAMASEDIGNADPRALQIAVAAAHAYERLGHPEGELALAHAAVYLAVAAKSNAVYNAWNKAKACAKESGSAPVPLHLRNAPAKLMQEMGYGAQYRYAHHEPNAYAAGQSYMPEGMEPPHWYQPTDRGLEPRIADKLRWLEGLDDAAKAVPPPASGNV